jgi:hypothetical protein
MALIDKLKGRISTLKYQVSEVWRDFNDGMISSSSWKIIDKLGNILIMEKIIFF